VHALADRGIRPKHAPIAHEPDAVREKLGDLSGVQVLLVREETAEAALPEGLRAAGADVTDVAGYRAVVRADARQLAALFADPPKLVAFPNPTAARMFRRAFEQLEVDAGPYLAGVKIAAVGPETAAAAERYGFPPNYVSSGRITAFVTDIAALC
jgi:uroporphyrinogen-III synthase